MPTYKLTYFDFDGGRAEPIRIAFHAAGMAFEDHRISFEEFGKLYPELPFEGVPVLEIDGTPITQSNALTRYVGRMAGLYPEDSLQGLYCDEALGTAEDVNHYIVQTFGLEGDALKAARKKLVDGWLKVYLKGQAGLLARSGGQYFAANRLTVADLKIFVQTRALNSGQLDHVPTDLVQRLAPALVEHEQRISAEPQVAAYYASRH